MRRSACGGGGPGREWVLTSSLLARIDLQFRVHGRDERDEVLLVRLEQPFVVHSGVAAVWAEASCGRLLFQAQDAASPSTLISSSSPLPPRLLSAPGEYQDELVGLCASLSSRRADHATRRTRRVLTADPLVPARRFRSRSYSATLRQGEYFSTCPSYSAVRAIQRWPGGPGQRMTSANAQSPRAPAGSRRSSSG